MDGTQTVTNPAGLRTAPGPRIPGIVRYNGGVAAFTVLGGAYTELEIAGPNLASTGNLDVSGDLTITGTGSLDTSTPHNITLDGNWTNSGTYTSGNNTITFTAAAADVTIQTGGTAAGQDFYDVSSTMGATRTFQLVGAANARQWRGNLSPPVPST